MNLLKLRKQEPDLEDEDSIEGDRDISSVNKGVTLQNKITNWLMIGGVAVVGAFGMYKYYAGMFHDYQQQKDPTKNAATTAPVADLPPLVVPAPDAVAHKDSAATDAPPPLTKPDPNTATGGGAPAGHPPTKTLGEIVRERRLKRELLFRVDSTTRAKPDVAVDSDQANTRSDDTSGGAGKAVRTAGFNAAHAYVLPDPSLIMTRGTAIPCPVKEAIDTTLTGMVTCVTEEDARSADDKVVLMNRGTKCIGRQGGGMTHGQRRVGIIWERCETPGPDHVLVPLDQSYASDDLGRPGIAGQVDNHFWDRFGAAIALSLISDVGPYLVATRQGGGSNNTTIAFPNIGSGPQEIMSEILKKTVDIPPTLNAPQANRVLIYLAGDIDFRDVYQLERTK